MMNLVLMLRQLTKRLYLKVVKYISKIAAKHGIVLKDG